MTTWDHWYDNDMPDIDPVTESKRIGNWLIEYADKYNGNFPILLFRSGRRIIETMQKDGYSAARIQRTLE